MTNKKGFTLVELIMVIVIIGILAVAALPSFYEMRGSARTAAMNGAAANVQAGISTWHYNKLLDNSDTYPQNLDTLAAPPGTSCTPINKCFDNVLSTPVTSPLWIKNSKGLYNFDVNGNNNHVNSGVDYQWRYECSVGTFLGSVIP